MINAFEVLLFAGTHPIEATRTIAETPVRQFMSGLGLETPPSGTTFETFPNLFFPIAAWKTLAAKAAENKSSSLNWRTVFEGLSEDAYPKDIDGKIEPKLGEIPRHDL